ANRRLGLWLQKEATAPCHSRRAPTMSSRTNVRDLPIVWVITQNSSDLASSCEVPRRLSRLGMAKMQQKLRARTHRWRSRRSRRNSCFPLLAFRSPRFLLRLLRFGQGAKLHDFRLHRTIRHFVIGTPHFRVRNDIFHRRWLTAFSDDSFVGNLERMRCLFSGDGERLCFV